MPAFRALLTCVHVLVMFRARAKMKRMRKGLAKDRGKKRKRCVLVKSSHEAVETLTDRLCDFVCVCVCVLSSQAGSSLRCEKLGLTSFSSSSSSFLHMPKVFVV